jgi:cell division protein FtsL
MSLPAREAERWAPAPPQPRRRAVNPARPPATRPPVPNPPHPHRRTRRGHHTGFWILTAVVVSSLVVGLVSVNAMRVDAAYRSRSLAEQVRIMSDQQRILVNDVAHLSSPSRIGRWAHRRGLVAPAPGDVVILQVPGSSDRAASSTVGTGE